MSSLPQDDESSLKTLVARAVDGDSDALAAMLGRYGPEIEGGFKSRASGGPSLSRATSCR